MNFVFLAIIAVLVYHVISALTRDSYNEFHENIERYIRSICLDINNEYDLSGTNEANKHNALLWRKHVKFANTLAYRKEERDLLEIARCNHLINLKVLKNNPGMFADSDTPVDEFGLKMFRKENL
jgi:uncharacterized membrane protein YgaE (UPF0421/DUF939 family)